MAGTLYLVRHGETLFNVRRVMQGWIDSPLTELGREQAARVGRYFKHEGITFDHAYASTLARTHQTIEAITDMPFERDPGLREMHFGEFEAERIELIPPRPWNDFFVRYGGESEDEFRERICSAFNAIMERSDHRDVLVVSHGSVCRMFMSVWANDPEIGLRAIPGNCSLMRYAYDNGVFKLEQVVEQEEMRAVLGE